MRIDSDRQETALESFGIPAGCNACPVLSRSSECGAVGKNAAAASAVQDKGAEASVEVGAEFFTRQLFDLLTSWRKAGNALDKRGAVVKGGPPEGGNIGVELNHEAFVDEVLHNSGKGDAAATRKRLNE